jgi:hypothetical protein
MTCYRKVYSFIREDDRWEFAIPYLLKVKGPLRSCNVASVTLLIFGVAYACEQTITLQAQGR